MNHHKTRSTFRHHGGAPSVKTNATRKQTQARSRFIKGLMLSLAAYKRKGDL